MAVKRVTYKANVILTIITITSKGELSEEQIAEASIDFEQAMNSLPGIVKKGYKIFHRVHMKEESKNGSD